MKSHKMPFFQKKRPPWKMS